MKRIDRNNLNPGDVVGVPFKVSIGRGSFRYPKFLPMTVERITPAKTKIVMTNGKELDRHDVMYELDNETQWKTAVAKCVENIGNKLYDIDKLERDGKCYSKDDDTIIAVSDLLDKIVEMLNNGK